MFVFVRSIRLVVVLFLTGAFLSSAYAAPLAFNDKRSLKLFKKDYERYVKYFENINPAERSELERYLVKLEGYMKRVSSSGREDPTIKDCLTKIDDLKAKMTAAFGEGGNASLPHIEEAKALVDRSAAEGLSKQELNTILIDLNDIHRKVKIAHQRATDSETKAAYEEMRVTLTDAVGATKKRITSASAVAETSVAANAGSTVKPVAVASAVPGGMSDADIARQFQKDYNDVYNQIRRTRGKDYLNDEVVKEIQGKLDVLKGHVGSVKDQSQPFYRQMKANHENLQAHLDKSVASVQNQKQQIDAQNAARATLAAEQAQAAEKARAQAAANASAVTVNPQQGLQTVVAPPAKLSYPARRAVSLFEKEQQRQVYNFYAIDKSRAQEYAKYLDKLNKMLSPISEAEKGHKDAKRCFDKVARLQAQFDEAFPDGVVIEKEGPKPLSIPDAKMVKLFDRDLGRYTAMFKRADVEEMLTIRECIKKLETHLSRVGFHGKKHEEYLKRQEQLNQVKADINKAFGDLREFTEDEEKLLSEFRAKFNGCSYIVTSNLNPIYLQDPAQRVKAEEALTEAVAPLNKIDNKNHPRFLQEMARFKELEEKYKKACEKSDKMDDLAGDVDGQLEMVQNQFNRETFTAELPKGANYAQIEEWAAKLKNWQVAAEEAKKFFKHAEKYSLKAKSNEFYQYTHWFNDTVSWDIKQALKRFDSDLDDPIRMGLNPPTGSYNLTNPAKVEKALNYIKEGKHALRSRIAYQQGYTGKADPELFEQMKKMDENASKISGKADEQLRNNRMPKAASTSPELMAIAEKAVEEASEEWDIGEVVRMVINYDKQHKSEVRYHDGTFYKLVWDEFQVTVAEKFDEKFWVRTCMIKYYYVGGEKRWKVVNSHRWGMILEENIHK